MTTCSSKQYSGEIIGVLPAGGRGERIAPLPCSKELFPIGFQETGEQNKSGPKVVSHYLLEKMRAAGAKKAFIVLREGKWDIPTYYGDGKMVDLHLAYLMMGRPDGAPFTLDQAYPFLQNDKVVFGFPDILFQPTNSFERLLIHQEETQAEIVLGLFPADKPHKMDMVELDGENRIQNILIKPSRTDLLYTWIIAVWTPVFSQFMHDFLGRITTGAVQELFVGDVILAAIKEGMHVEPVIFSQGRYIDIGTPEDLIRAVEGSWF